MTAGVITTLRNLLTPKIMEPIMALQNTSLGFRTDNFNGYPVDVVKDALIEATFKGVYPANASLAKSERAAVISKIASTHNFSDSDYLDFLANSKELDLKDDSAVASFMKELSSSRPELFKSSAKPGGGTSGNGKNNTSGNAARLKELLGKDELTPREAAEVYELQSGKSGEGDGDSGEGAKQ